MGGNLLIFQSHNLLDLLARFALCPAFPGSNGGSSRPRLLPGLRPTPWRAGGDQPKPGQRAPAPRGGSHVHHVSIGQSGTQLYPGSIAAATP